MKVQCNYIGPGAQLAMFEPIWRTILTIQGNADRQPLATGVAILMEMDDDVVRDTTGLAVTCTRFLVSTSDVVSVRYQSTMGLSVVGDQESGARRQNSLAEAHLNEQRLHGRYRYAEVLRVFFHMLRPIFAEQMRGYP